MAPEPFGFPLDAEMMTDLVVGPVGARAIATGAGPSVLDASATGHASDDSARASAAGWNCRVHLEYEGEPAVDWYVQPRTPVYATMDGVASLLINTYVNAFDFYGVAREPYLGEPDRPRAPLSPFPGPGGGMGVYVAVTNDLYRTDYGHLALEETIAPIPADAFVGGYTPSFDYGAAFGVPLAFNVSEEIAMWTVRRGDVIGYTGDAGYSEAPHLHYSITRRATGEQLCPTSEAAFDDNGWLTTEP